MAKIRCLKLGEFKEMHTKKIITKLVEDFQVPRGDVVKYDLCIAHMYYDSSGYSAYCKVLLRDKATGEYYFNYGYHCSCSGFEGQWTPEKTSLDTSLGIYGSIGETEEEKKKASRKIREMLKSGSSLC